MRKRGRVWRVGKWAGTLVCTFIGAIWTASLWGEGTYDFTAFTCVPTVDVSGGEVCVQWLDGPDAWCEQIRKDRSQFEQARWSWDVPQFRRRQPLMRRIGLVRPTGGSEPTKMA